MKSPQKHVCAESIVLLIWSIKNYLCVTVWSTYFSNTTTLIMDNEEVQDECLIKITNLTCHSRITHTV